jgi:HPt (histidine-containing phosphotransfer) domain-containing protein
MDAATNSRKGRPNSEGATAAGAVIDLAHLRRFTLGDEQLEQEILTLFIEQAPLTINSLKRARTDRDWVTAAHTLKGSARAVGAWRMASLAERAEDLGGPSDRAACERLLRELEEAAGEARAHIRSLGYAL